MTRLIVTIPPLPWESLEGYLDRLRIANTYVEQTWMTELLDSSPELRINVLRQQRDYQRLTSLTMLEQHVLRSMTLHRVVDRFYLPHALPQSDAGSNEINEPLWDDGGLTVYAMGQGRKALRKICPECWRQHRTLFLPWSLRHVTCCPVHMTLLVDRCVCGRPLKFSLLKARCFACHTSLDQLSARSIIDHAPSVALTALISSAIGYTDQFPSSSLSFAPNHPLWTMHPAALFRFLVFEAQLLAARYPDDPLFDTDHLLSTEQLTTPGQSHLIIPGPEQDSGH